MPELPEVETVRRGLEPALVDQRVKTVRLNRADLRFPIPDNLAEIVSCKRITGLRRRAKYLLIELDSGHTLLVHLGMTGRFTVWPQKGAVHNLGEFYYQDQAGYSGDGAHDHIVIDLDNDARIVYTDPRRFGFVDLIEPGGVGGNRFLANLGVEPLGNELHAEFLANALAGRKSPLKAALLDQRIIAGLGNIYVCEALFRSRLSPKRQSASIVRKRGPSPLVEALVLGIRSILTEALEAGGSTLRDYARTDGSSGEFQQRFDVYDREGEACRTQGCNSMIKRLVQSGRSSFYCPTCQR